jgi:hypothetical protein
MRAVLESGQYEDILREITRVFPDVRHLDRAFREFGFHNDPVGISLIKLYCTITIENKGSVPARFVPLDSTRELERQDWMTDGTLFHCAIEFNHPLDRVIEVGARKQVSLPASVTLRLEGWPQSTTYVERISRWLSAGQAFTTSLHNRIEGPTFEADTQDGRKRLLQFGLKITIGEAELDKVVSIDVDKVIESLENIGREGSALLDAKLYLLNAQGEKE